MDCHLLDMWLDVMVVSDKPLLCTTINFLLLAFPNTTLSSLFMNPNLPNIVLSISSVETVTQVLCNTHSLLIDSQSHPWPNIVHMKSTNEMVQHFHSLSINLFLLLPPPLNHPQKSNKKPVPGQMILHVNYEKNKETILINRAVSQTPGTNNTY